MIMTEQRTTHFVIATIDCDLGMKNLEKEVVV